MKMKKIIPVRGHYRTINGKRVWVERHLRFKPQTKTNKNIKLLELKQKEELSFNDDEAELGENFAYVQGYKRKSIKTSEIITEKDSKEDEDYQWKKKALLSLEEKQILERKDSKKEIEPSWKLTYKGKKQFSDPYLDGIAERNEEKAD